MDEYRNRGSPRLQFTREELENDALSRPIAKVEKAADKYEAARKKLKKKRLRLVRAELAQKRHCPPYMIFGDAVLRELAERRPMCAEDAEGIKGIGPQKMQSVLPAFLREIQQWCNGH